MKLAMKTAALMLIVAWALRLGMHLMYGGLP